MNKMRQKPTSSFRPPRTVSNPDFLDRGSDAEFRESIYAFLQGAGRLSTCREAFGRSLGLTGSQFAVLIGIAYHQGLAGVTVRDLAKHVALASTHVTTEVGRLTESGFLIKRPNQSDRRSVLISLSKAGERAVLNVSPFVRTINDILFAGINPKDLAVVHSVARKLVANSEHAMIELNRRSIRMTKRNST